MKRQSAVVPTTLRPRLEAARLDNLALMRVLDGSGLGDPYLHDPAMRAFFELDADCAEALAVMLRPPGFAINWHAMLRDTEATLRRLPAARQRVRVLVAPESWEALAAEEVSLRASLAPHEAYNDIPGA